MRIGVGKSSRIFARLTSGWWKVFRGGKSIWDLQSGPSIRFREESVTLHKHGWFKLTRFTHEKVINTRCLLSRSLSNQSADVSVENSETGKVGAHRFSNRAELFKTRLPRRDEKALEKDREENRDGNNSRDEPLDHVFATSSDLFNTRKCLFSLSLLSDLSDQSSGDFLPRKGSRN